MAFIVRTRLACTYIMVVAFSYGNPVGVTSFHGIVLDHQLIIIYSRALITGSIRISIVYGVGVHSYCALKYAGKPWVRQCFKSTISPNFFTAKVFYYMVYGRL